MNFAVSYSGGKDGALSLYKMLQAGHKPVALVTTVNVELGRSWFHGIQTKLLNAVSESLGVPLITCESAPEGYTESFERGLSKARELGAEACVFGDIDVEGHKEWNEERCKSAGLECVMPLWQMNREAVISEFLNAGFLALIKIVDARILDESLLGQTLDFPLIERIKAAGADACGENGEYHTFVYGGPAFARPIPIKTGEIIDLGTHKAVNLLW